jgi:DNA-binding transcriptional ArsR family regulator
MLKHDDLDRVFHALSDASRRAMVERLVRGPASVSTLAEPHAMTLSAVVQHLAVLAGAGLVESHKVGRVRTYQLVPGALDAATGWIGGQRLPAERRLDRLGTYLGATASDAAAPATRPSAADSDGPAQEHR